MSSSSTSASERCERSRKTVLGMAGKSERAKCAPHHRGERRRGLQRPPYELRRALNDSAKRARAIQYAIDSESGQQRAPRERGDARAVIRRRVAVLPVPSLHFMGASPSAATLAQ
jgi:hypothetical protein